MQKGNIVYESGTVRGEGGTLFITENQPCVIPFLFQIKLHDATTNTESDYIIKPTDVLEFTIKSDIKLISDVLVKRYNGIINNTAILRFTAQDMRNFLGGKNYYMSVKLYNVSGSLIKTLIKKLQIHVQEVV